MRVKAGESINLALPVKALPTFTAPADTITPIEIETVTITGRNIKALNSENETERRFDRRVVKEGNPLFDKLGLTEFCVLYGLVETDFTSGEQFFVQFISHEWENDEVSYVFFRDAGVYVNTGVRDLGDDDLYLVKQAAVDYITECLYGTSNPEGWSDYYYGHTYVEHPVDNQRRTLQSCIINLNDREKWSREKIAEWIRSLGPKAPKIERFTASWILSTEDVTTI